MELGWLLSGNKLPGLQPGGLAERWALRFLLPEPIPTATSRSNQMGEYFLSPWDHGEVGSALSGVIPARDTSRAGTPYFSGGELSRGDLIQGFSLRYSKPVVLDACIFGFFEMFGWQWALMEIAGGSVSQRLSHILGPYWERMKRDAFIWEEVEVFAVK